MELKLLNYSIFVTESELKRIGKENFQLIKGTAKEKNAKDVERDFNCFEFNSFQRSAKRKATNILYINKKNTANDIILKFCNNMDNNKKNLYSAVITSEIEIQNTEMFIDVLSSILKKFDLKTYSYIIKRIEQIKNKIVNNEELNESDIKFNQTLTKIVYKAINKYYQGIEVESFITKLTTTYLYEKDVVLKKAK